MNLAFSKLENLEITHIYTYIHPLIVRNQSITYHHAVVTFLHLYIDDNRDVTGQG